MSKPKKTKRSPLKAKLQVESNTGVGDYHRAALRHHRIDLFREENCDLFDVDLTQRAGAVLELAPEAKDEIGHAVATGE